jgi:hypothetical protein
MCGGSFERSPHRIRLISFNFMTFDGGCNTRDPPSHLWRSRAIELPPMHHFTSPDLGHILSTIRLEPGPS